MKKMLLIYNNPLGQTKNKLRSHKYEKQVYILYVLIVSVLLSPYIFVYVLVQNNYLRVIYVTIQSILNMAHAK